MHKKTAYRWRISAVLLAGVGFAVGSFWLLWLLGQGLQTFFPQLLKLKILIYMPQ